MGRQDGEGLYHDALRAAMRAADQHARVKRERDQADQLVRVSRDLVDASRKLVSLTRARLARRP